MLITNGNIARTAAQAHGPPEGAGHEAKPQAAPTLSEGASRVSDGAAPKTEESQPKQPKDGPFAAGIQVTETEVAEAAARVNEHLQQTNRSLKFSVDEPTGRTVITVTDAETDEIIRQIPPEELLAIQHRLADQGAEGELPGLLLRESV